MSEKKTTGTEEMTTVEVVDVQFRPGQKVYYFAYPKAMYMNSTPSPHCLSNNSHSSGCRRACHYEFNLCFFVG